jgi:hypothetical protein
VRLPSAARQKSGKPVVKGLISCARFYPDSGLAETSECVRRCLFNNKGEVAVTAHPPPVPPANRKKIGADQEVPGQASETVQTKRNPPNNHQDRQADIAQNTKHPGYQQDR